MKKWLIFLGGVVTGVLLTFLFAFMFSSQKETSVKEDSGLTMFEQPGDVITEKSFKVIQALEQGAALADGEKEYMTTFLLVNDEGKYYYDHEIVKVPSGKVARQVGIFKYTSGGGLDRTVPVVKFVDK